MNQYGYITEKIFDSFFAGYVPIYWGAKNITEHVPSNCFNDKREFDSFESVYNFLKNISEKTYMDYLSNIESFLNSSNSNQFKHDTFTNTIADAITQDLTKL